MRVVCAWQDGAFGGDDEHCETRESVKRLAKMSMNQRSKAGGRKKGGGNASGAKRL